MYSIGFCNITVYDGDQLEPDNMMRWAYGGFGQGLEKPYSLRLFLEYLHPEIHIRAIGKDLDKDAFLQLLVAEMKYQILHGEDVKIY